MKIIYHNSLKLLRKAYCLSHPDSSYLGRNWSIMPNKIYSSSLIYNALLDSNPLMIARFGSSELECIVNFLGIHDPEKYRSIKRFILGKSPSWWWEPNAIKHMHQNAGFFPASIEKIEMFCELMLKEIPYVDILGSWRKEEIFIGDMLNHTKKVMLEDLEPFFTAKPWTNALEGKKVLVIHPFEETIKMQFKKRQYLFENDLLPSFELLTIKAVQSISDEKNSLQRLV